MSKTGRCLNLFFINKTFDLNGFYNLYLFVLACNCIFEFPGFFLNAFVGCYVGGKPNFSFTCAQEWMVELIISGFYQVFINDDVYLTNLSCVMKFVNRIGT